MINEREIWKTDNVKFLCYFLFLFVLWVLFFQLLLLFMFVKHNTFIWLLLPENRTDLFDFHIILNYPEHIYAFLPLLLKCNVPHINF